MIKRTLSTLVAWSNDGLSRKGLPSAIQSPVKHHPQSPQKDGRLPWCLLNCFGGKPDGRDGVIDRMPESGSAREGWSPALSTHLELENDTQAVSRMG